MQWIRWMLVGMGANAIMMAALAAGSYTDVRWRRLPNWLTIGAAGIGLALQVGLRGADGARDSLLGWALGCALLFLPFALGGMGAGDVKLMGAIGALKGPSFVLNAFAYTAFFGGILAVALIARRHGLLNLPHRTVSGLASGVRALFAYRSVPTAVMLAARPDGGLVPVLAKPESRATQIALPYGVAIAAGALFSLMMGH